MRIVLDYLHRSYSQSFKLWESGGHMGEIYLTRQLQKTTPPKLESTQNSNRAKTKSAQTAGYPNHSYSRDWL